MPKDQLLKTDRESDWDHLNGKFFLRSLTPRPSVLWNYYTLEIFHYREELKQHHFPIWISAANLKEINEIY
jgi:hypothetical protein